jgi:hypothetical protein
MPANDRNSLIKRLDKTIKKLRHDHITESTETGSSFMYNDIFQSVLHRRDEAMMVDFYERSTLNVMDRLTCSPSKHGRMLPSINARQGRPSKVLSSAFETSTSQTRSNARLPSRDRSSRP